MKRFSAGFSLTELLVCFFISMLLISVLIEHLLSVSRQYQHTHAVLDETIELQWVFDVMRTRIHHAGFTPCRGLNQLKTIDTREIPEILQAIEVQQGKTPKLKITHAVRKIVASGSFPVIVGGDHSITFPSVRGFNSYADLDVVHFDAHMDFSHELQGTFYHHGCPIRRCFDLPNVRNITSLGIRKATPSIYKDAISKGVRIVTTDQFRAMGPEAAVAEIPAGGNVYLTVDVDVMDPVQMPGTGSPAPGGFYYFEMRDALIALTKRVNIVGCDFVEVAPPYDHAETTTGCTAKLIMDLLAELFPSK